jgi:hypothetical protein
MHAYDFILVLFSFVYAAAITHILSVAGEIIIASPRCDFHSAAMDTGGRSNNTDHGLALVLRQTSVRVVGVARTLAGPTHST